VRVQNSGGGTGQNQNWCLIKPGFPVKNRVLGQNPFFREKICENAQNIKKLLFRENSEKCQFFGKLHPPPSTFFGPSKG